MTTILLGITFGLIGFIIQELGLDSPMLYFVLGGTFMYFAWESVR